MYTAMRNFPTLASINLLILLVLSGCASKGGEEGPERPARDIYISAKQAMDKGNFQTAIELYEDLETRYPFGRYADQAQLEIIYAYFRGGHLASAVGAADRYIRLHPTSPHVDYAYFMRGMAHYRTYMSFIFRYVALDPSRRDLTAASNAFHDFDELIRRYPNSMYTADAHQRMVHIRNALAEQELHIADYYMRREAYLAAANRSRYVVEHFQGAPVMPEALTTLAEAYEAMALPELAETVWKVYDDNFPEQAA